MGSSYTYTWCNSTRVTIFLSHRSMRDPTDKNKTSLFFITLNTYLINSLLTISLLIKYFLCLFFSLLLSLSFHFLCNFSYVSTFQNKEKKKTIHISDWNEARHINFETFKIKGENFNLCFISLSHSRRGMVDTCVIATRDTQYVVPSPP